MLVSIFC